MDGNAYEEVRNSDRPPVGFPPAGLVETHSGTVVFFGARAYKVKKPLDLGFLDFRTRESREAACHREVELNRRLAPDVYLGVSDVHDPDGTLCEHLVVMRRMPTDRRLSVLAASGADLAPDLSALAGLLARFHTDADTGPHIDREAGVEATARRWRDNTSEMRALASDALPVAVIEEVDALAARYLAGRGPLLAGRVAEGRSRDGHGDLLAEDIFLLDDGPRVLDCLEFDDSLRFGDVLADVAFLAMDLEHLGRADLAAHFLEAYRRESGDGWPASLAHHHIAYRAQVRAKVTAIRAAQGAEGAAEQARRLLDLCLAHLREAEVRLVLVGGRPGTGKSTVAAGLGEAIGAVVLRSDVIRKERAGLSPTDSAAAAFGEGIYSPAATDATYRDVLDRARHHLSMGETVVLDASWSREVHRALAREVASDTSSSLVELQCVLDPEVAAERIAERARRGGDPSDADADVAAAMASTEDDWPGSTPIDTASAPDEVVASVLGVLGRASS